MVPPPARATRKDELDMKYRSNSGYSSHRIKSGCNAKRIFVGGLSWRTTSVKLKYYFSQFGAVTEAQVLIDHATCRSRGFGFITFRDESVASRVVALSLTLELLDGNRIEAKPAIPSKNFIASTVTAKKVFVGGFRDEITVEDIKAHFSQFGKIEEAKVFIDQQTKRSRGFGFITFVSEDVANLVCKMHQHTIKGSKVECKTALKRDRSIHLNMLKNMEIHPPLVTPVLPTYYIGHGLSGLEHARLENNEMAIPTVTMAPTTTTRCRYPLMNEVVSYSPPGSYRYTPYPLPISSVNTANYNAFPIFPFPTIPTPTYLHFPPGVIESFNINWPTIYSHFLP